jgi:hypothetical protein
LSKNIAWQRRGRISIVAFHIILRWPHRWVLGVLEEIMLNRPAQWRRSKPLLRTPARQRYGAEALEPRKLFNLDRPFQAYLGDNGEAVLWGNDQGSFHDLADTSGLAQNRSSSGRQASGDYVYGGTKWNTTSITWGYSNLLDGGLPLAAGTTLADIKAACVEALGLWSAVTGIKFIYVNDPGGVAVQDGTNYDGTNFPTIRIGHHFIDGSTGLNVLAHCYYPSNNYTTNGRAGDLHLDDSNTWGNGTGGGINTMETILHEVGHGLGLDHANGDVSGSCPPSKPAIMDACIQGRFGGLNTAYLFLDDIQGMQSVYGAGLGYVQDDVGIVHVFGTGVASNVDGINTMVVTKTTQSIFNYYQVTSTYGSTLISTAGLNGLVIEGMGGTDYLRVDSSWAGIPITLRGGDGDDFYDFGFNSHDLGGINSNVQVIGGAGYDQIFVYDDATAGAQTYTVTAARLDRSNGWGGFNYASDVDHLFLQTGLGSDVVNVLSTYAGQPIVLNSKGGLDVVNIGNAGSAQGLASEVQINNSPSYTTVNINNSNDTAVRNWLVNDPASGYGGIAGLAPSLISWKNGDIDAVNLTTGSGNDNGNIARLGVTLNINNVGSGNLDQITVGNSSAGGLASIFNGRQGGLTIDNDPAYTRLNIDDKGSSIARTATLDIIGGYNVLTGLAPATIRFDDGDLQEVTIRSGSGNDTINVARYNAANPSANTLTINTTGGDDIVNLGNNTDGVRSITAPIVVRNTPAHSTLNIANNFDSIGRTVGIDFNPATELQTITGLAAAPISYRYLDIDAANGVTITNGGGVDNYLIAANARKLNLTTVSSADNIAIGPDLSKITAEIYVRNPNSRSNVSISDTSASAGRNYWISYTTIGSETFQSVALNGLLSTSIHLKAVDINSPVTMYGGSGDDTFTLMSTTNGFDIRGNNGADTLNYGGNLAALRKTDLLQAASSFTGGAGANVVSVNDVDYAAATGVVTVNPTTVTSNHAATLTFSDAVRVVANLSNSGETLNVTDTLATFLVDAVGGNAKDTIGIARTATGSYVRLFPSSGFDDVTVDTTGAAPNAGLQLNGNVFDLGALVIKNAGVVAQATGTASTRVKSLSFTGHGGFDLGNGSLVVDYTGATQLTNLRANILTGYNAGAWNGGAIYSTYNITHAQYAIGYAEATAIRTAFPAAFEAFNNVDNTSILIRNTLKGDANLDRTVNFADLIPLAQSYSGTGKVWTQGDFDYDGDVDFQDLVPLAQNYNMSFNIDAVFAAIRAGAATARLEAATRMPTQKQGKTARDTGGDLTIA